MEEFAALKREREKKMKELRERKKVRRHEAGGFDDAVVPGSLNVFILYYACVLTWAFVPDCLSCCPRILIYRRISILDPVVTI